MSVISKLTTTIAETALPDAAQAQPDLLAELTALSARTVERNGGQSFASTAGRVAHEGATQLTSTMHTNPKVIARELDLSVRQVKDAIHALKGELNIGGTRSNPDFVIDTSNGDAFVQVGSNRAGELAGNLLSFVN